MEPTVTKRYSTIEVSRPFFYYSASYGVENAETTCLLEIRLKGHPELPDQTFYARGSAEWSSKERGGPNRKVGRRIAEQRARKVLEWFSNTYDLKEFKSEYEKSLQLFKHVYPNAYGFGKGQGQIGMHRLGLLLPEDLDGLERKIFGLDKPAKDSEKEVPPLPPATMSPPIPSGAQFSKDDEGSGESDKI
ncbi:MAG: hypothetical protein HY438_01985 [DPANN group archaeon]|nr:hypothetical protein [DPANN group archaeon]